MCESEMARVLLPAAAVVVLFLNHRRIAAAIERFKDNWPRGGPRTPMHPSPARDPRRAYRAGSADGTRTGRI